MVEFGVGSGHCVFQVGSPICVTMNSAKKLLVGLSFVVASCQLPLSSSGSDRFLADFEHGESSDRDISLNINALDENGQTPLYRAANARSPDTALIGRLLEAGADPFMGQGDGQYPIRTILSIENTKLFEVAACSRVTVPSQKFAPIDGNSVFDRYSTIVHDAAVRGTAENIHSLASCGYDLNEENGMGQTPIVLAAGVNADTFQALLSNGANPDYATDTLAKVCGRITRKPLASVKEEYILSLRQHGFNC